MLVAVGMVLLCCSMGWEIHCGKKSDNNIKKQ